jgi:hypothetical protein
MRDVAFRIELINSWAENGFCKKAVQPASIASLRTSIVSSAVIKITGVVELIAFNRRCISMQDIPPMCVYVEDNARHIARAIAVKKCLSGTEGFRSKVRRVQYPLEPVWSKYWSEASISSIENLIALITVPAPHRRPG